MPSSDRLAARRFELVAAEYVQRIGARIAARRVEQGLSQVDIARALPGKVDGSQVSRWERGLHRPSDDTLERLGDILDVPVSYFMADQPTKDETPDPFAGTPEERFDRIETTLEQMRAERDEHAQKVEQLLQEQSELLATIRGLLGVDGEITLQDRLVQMLRDAAAQAGAPAPPRSEPEPTEPS